jgi:hypothetical protein
MSIEIKPGDVLRLKRKFTLSAQNDSGLDVETTFGVGQLMTITDLQGDDIHCCLHVGCGVFEADFTTTFSAQHLDEDTIELLRPLEEELEPERPDEPQESTMPDCQHLRYSIAMAKATTKRPEIFLYQGALKAVGAYTGAVDGWYGNGSAKAVREFQTANQLEPVDGIIGRDTATALIQQATAAGFKPELNYRIMSVIAVYEVSNRANAFGMAENDIGDNAGANYGIFQCNKLGSVNAMLKLAGRDDLRQQYNSTDKTVVNADVRDWFGSAEGIATQVKYFEENTIKGAMRELRDFGLFDAWEAEPAMKMYWERAVLLFCDSRIQNGTMWSGKRRPFWKDLVGQENYKAYQNVPELYHGTWWDEMLGQYCKYEDMKKLWWAEYEKQDQDKVATTKAVAKHIAGDLVPDDDPQAKLVVLAQLRARSSWEKFWFQAVASRRITDATGNSANHPEGDVNDSKIDLACAFQI